MSTHSGPRLTRLVVADQVKVQVDHERARSATRTVAPRPPVGARVAPWQSTRGRHGVHDRDDHGRGAGAVEALGPDRARARTMRHSGLADADTRRTAAAGLPEAAGH